MSVSNVRLILSACGVALSFAAIDSAQADIRVFGAAGYATTTAEDSTAENKELTGYDVNLNAQFDVFSIGIAAIYAGPSFKMSALSKEYTANGANVTQALAASHAGVEAGVNIGAIPLLTVQAGLNYNVALDAKGTREITGDGKVELEGESGSEMGVTLRALITPFPLLRAGLEVGVGTGSAQYKGKTSEDKYSYSSIRAVVGISL